MAQRELLVTSQGDSAINVFRYTQFLTFIPGIFLGIIVDRIGSSESMIVLQTFVVGCIFYLVGGALYLSIIYFFVYEYFPPERIGCALGIILIFCGSAVMLNIPVYKLGLKFKEKGDFATICYLLEAYIAISILTMLCLIVMKRKKGLNEENAVENNS